MWLSGGRQLHLPLPLPGEICIEDIAHALSNICRFGGHTSRFYCVAEHSLRVSYYVGIQAVRTPEELHQKRIHALAGLLHDAPEAYLGDMIRPLKHGTLIGEEYRVFEEILHREIFRTFGLPAELPEEVKAADAYFCARELADLILGRGPGILRRGEYPPDCVRDGFLRRFYALQNAIQLGPKLAKLFPEEEGYLQ